MSSQGGKFGVDPFHPEKLGAAILESTKAYGFYALTTQPLCRIREAPKGVRYVAEYPRSSTINRSDHSKE
jgi:hypothetical protein